MVILLLALVALAAEAQPTGDGVALLRQVSKNARSAAGWHAEGSVAVAIDPGPSGGFGRSESVRGLFVSTRGPLESRHSLAGLTVCDGLRSWNHRESMGGGGSVSESRAAASAQICNTPLQWENLLGSLQSAVVLVRDSSQGWILVSAEYFLPDGLGFEILTTQPVGAIRREMYVDTSRDVIIQERISGIAANGDRVTVNIAYTKIERDPQFGPDEFRIPPPPPPTPPPPRPIDLNGLPYCLSGCLRFPLPGPR